VQLRWIDLGIGMWHADPAARRYGQQLRACGTKGGVIGCAMANRANKITYAMVRDQSGYDPDRWAPDCTGDSSIAAHAVARSNGQLGAPTAQRGRTRLTAASSDAQSSGEEAPGEELISARHTSPAGDTLGNTKGRTDADMTMADATGVTPCLV
jgi:hypothetical protein